MTVTREEAVAQLERERQKRIDARTFWVIKSINEAITYICGSDAKDKYQDVEYELYDYHDSRRFICRFKYDDFQFKLKVKPSAEYGGATRSSLYIKTTRRWKEVYIAEDILSLLERGKLPKSI